MITSSRPRRMLAATLVTAAIGFGVYMNHVGQLTNPFQWEIAYQSDVVFASTSVQRDLVDEIAWRILANPDYRVVIHAHQGTSLPEGTSQKWGETLKAYLVQHGIDPAVVYVEDHGVAMVTPRGQHETNALWQKRLNRIEVELTTENRE
jgi:hypothetical protein